MVISFTKQTYVLYLGAGLNGFFAARAGAVSAFAAEKYPET
jgi:hypothetical protein